MTMSFALRAVAFFCFVTFATAEAATYVVIVKDLARVLLLPYGDSKLLGLVKKGEQFKVITKKNDWFNVEYKNTVGWIFQENVRVDLKTEAPVKEPAPPPPPPVAAQPAPVKPQNIVEIKKPLEKPELTAEKIEARLKKQPAKPKRVQSFAVDLPPVSVIPAEADQEKTLPVMEDTTEVISSQPSESSQNPAVSRPPPQTATAVKKPDLSSLPSIPSPVGSRIPYQTAKDSFVGLVQPQDKSDEAKKYFEIIENSVNVLATVSPH
jgi:hypothetical protein